LEEAELKYEGYTYFVKSCTRNYQFYYKT